MQSLENSDPCGRLNQPRAVVPLQLGQLSQLTKLSMGMGVAPVSTARIDAMLRILPSLQHFRLQFNFCNSQREEFSRVSSPAVLS